jgi:Ca-activated chloride channel family protein
MTNPALETDTLRLGTLLVQGPEASSLPLEHTDVVAQITGPLASVAVRQRFANPFTQPIDLTYRFPLPHEAAIIDFVLQIGEREVRAELKELEQAKQEFANARDAGQHAALLDQRALSVFAVDLANVQSNQSIEVVVRYQQRVRYDDGVYEFVFPMGLTPRYHADPRVQAEANAPVAASGSPIGTVDLSISVNAGLPFGKPESPSHQLGITMLDEQRCLVQSLGELIPNKDFVLRYAVSEEAVRATAWSTPTVGGHTVLLTALPPRLDLSLEPAPREFVFVIDRSGSMSGQPFEQARNALRACLRALGSKDTFAIQAFDHEIEWFSEQLQPVSQQQVEQADVWLEQLFARGGTEIQRALEQALSLPVDPERQRYVVFLTDGAVAAEEQVLRALGQLLGRTRLFTFGIGSSVNRALLKRLAVLGHGTAEFLQLNEDIESAIIRFQDRVSYPVVQDIALEWQGGQAWDVLPKQLPDLYVGQPLEILARFRPDGSKPAAVLIRGVRDREPVELRVDLPLSNNAEPAISRAWTQARISDLIDVVRDNPERRDAIRAEIIGLSLAERVLSPFTGFVAVDRSTTHGRKEAKQIVVSVPLPEGVSFEEPSRPVMFAAATGILRKTSRSRGFGNRMHETRSGGFSPDMLGLAMPAPAPAPAALSASDAPVFAKAAATPPSAPVTPSVPSEDLPRQLARIQQVDGSWKGDVLFTAAALLVFVRAGLTTHSGMYRRQLAKTVAWLQQAQASGFAAQARAQALDELAQATGDAGQAAAAQQAWQGVNPPPAARLESVSTIEDLGQMALAKAKVSIDEALFSGPDAELARLWQASLVAV